MVCCLLQAGTVTGRMELEPGLRVSDFVAQHQGFLVLRHAVLGPAHEPAALVFVNARACVGVGDLGPQGAGAGAPGEVEIEVEVEVAPPGSGMPA
jgi:hypothetical protein